MGQGEGRAAVRTGAADPVAAREVGAGHAAQEGLPALQSWCRTTVVVADEQRRPWWWRPLGITGAALLFAGFVWLWWQGVPALYRTAGGGEDARLNAVTTTRAALLAGLAALGALGTFWSSARTQRFTAETLRISEKNFQLTERGHLTDRYAKAIEQLGSENLDVRLGGIYAVEQIATDSPRDRDQATIVEVLSAFVRVHSDPLYQYKASLPKDAPAEPAEQQREKATEYIAELKRPSVDVQAAVTVLGRLPLRPRVQRADLTGAYLAGAELHGVNLIGGDLRGANLTEADLRGANLTEADLRGADLTQADLSEANLTQADLSGADLTQADLSEANLTETQVVEANLTQANLVKADLTNADLAGADLTKARLFGLDLTRAQFGVLQHGRDMLVIDRTKAQKQLDNAIGDSLTRLPGGVRRPKSWKS
jgi:hypothetical protein